MKASRHTRRGFLRTLGLGAAAVALRQAPAAPTATRKPNILLVVSDDQSWPHAGVYGDRVVQTPAFDRIAEEGVLFSHAFCSAPSCTPSRAAMLTGQDIWRLEEGANLCGTLPSKFAVYPDLVEAAGYAVGYTGKGWSPGKLGGRKRNPAGPRFGSFEAFMKQVPAGKPFSFWYGSFEPHRPYKKGSGMAAGKSQEDVVVPAFLPDVPEVRSDLLDYYQEIERFDQQLAGLVACLEKEGRLDDTLIVVTSDNGMPFPRGKTTLYDAGTRMPLAIRWGSKIQGGRKVGDFVTLTDLAPTFLEAAGLNIPAEMTSRSLMPLLTSTASGQIDAKRDSVIVGRERHGWNREPNVGYPCRAIRTKEYLYIRNFKPDRQPGFDTDPGPSLEYMLKHRDEERMRRLFALWFEPRPAEELYNVGTDPDQMNNVEADPKYAAVKARLRNTLDAYLKQTGDPRVSGRGEVFDSYRYYGRPTGNSTLLDKGAER